MSSRGNPYEKEHAFFRPSFSQTTLNESFANGTPDNAYSNGITDLFVSPEIMEQVRAFAYQPMNTRAGGASTTGLIALPDDMREGIYNAAGMNEIYGVVLHELNELGTTKKYNVLFDSLLTTDSVTGIPTGGGTRTYAQSNTWVSATDQICVGVDNSKGAFIRPVATQDNASGGSFTVLPDDQFTQRADKTGFYGFLEEGRVCIDSRAVVGLVV